MYVDRHRHNINAMSLNRVCRSRRTRSAVHGERFTVLSVIVYFSTPSTSCCSTGDQLQRLDSALGLSESYDPIQKEKTLDGGWIILKNIESKG